MNQILKPEELTELTGSKTAQTQMRILANHGIKFITRTDGKIRTTWQAVNSALVQQQKKSEDEPDLDFLRQ